ncbi:MAG TPA: NAD(P)H-hydrate dehydratase [Candidatus Latescibacteria bacterium]|nr:NAD(P)H-hydrate dehydratase [Candidatus Latescibacterota bacterium]
MKLVTGTQMASVDRKAIEEFKIPGLDLMEKAGRAAFRVALDMLKGARGRKVVVVCGRGNNGGDGFVVARLLKGEGAEVRVFLLGERSKVRGDALINLVRAEQVGVQIEEIVGPEGLARLGKVLPNADLVVDAIFGTGFKGKAEGIPAEAISSINSSGKPVLSVDLPSGVEADTGKVHGPAVMADRTVTFGLPKLGQAFHPGKSHCGVLQVADIGFPEEALGSVQAVAEWVTEDEVRAKLPGRPPTAHKGTCGKVAVVAGSVGFTGAAALTAMAALRTGSGLVYLGTPKSLNDILEVKLTEVITRPLPEVRSRRCLALRAAGEVYRLLEETDVLAMGPGLGTYRETVELVGRVVRRLRKPAVLDADALNALSRDPSPLLEREVPLVLTPHPGELSRLMGVPAPEITSDPLRYARETASRFSSVVVLKGAPTVTATPEGMAYVNPTGNEGMATGGAGDVLTGVIASLIGQGLSPEDAAWVGAYIHGLAGDLARDEKGVHGMVAGDILDNVPEVIRMLSGRDSSGGEI